MTTAEAIKDIAAALGTIGTIAAVIAHLPFVPARWAEAFARFASFTSGKFDVTRKDTPPDVQAVPVHITIPPEARRPDDLPPAALKSLLLAGLLLSCSPAATQQAEKRAAQCVDSQPVRECLAQFKCDAPAKPCAAARVAYTVACLDLCEPKDAGSD